MTFSPVDSHADYDVDTAGHEGVDEGHHQMCLSLSLVVGNYGGQLTYQVNASELHFARSFQRHPTGPYLARPNMCQKCVFGIFYIHFSLMRGHPFFTYEGGKSKKSFFGPT